VLRRCTGSLALLTALATLTARVNPADAASIVTENGTKYAYYELVNNRSTPVNSLVVLNEQPPDSVVPLIPGTTAVNPGPFPLAIVHGSKGFDPNGPLPVFLSQPGQTPQGLAIDFSHFGKNDNTLAPGGVLNFKVSLDPNYGATMAPTLTLQPPDTDLSSTKSADLLSYTPAAPNGAPPVPEMTNTPEPVSLALWSALACAGLARARAFRRANRGASA